MKIDKVCLITFSPTRTSKQVGEAIVRGVAADSVELVDLTLPGAEVGEVASDTLAVIAVPVYGGHVAPLAKFRLGSLRACGAPAVVVAVYGNRAYEKALVELDACATEVGFKVIGAATFVGEHSYSSVSHPIAAGRPDGDDLRFAEEFGVGIRAKVEAAGDMSRLYGVDVSRIPRPKQSIWSMLMFVRQIMKWRKNPPADMPRHPRVDAAKCTACGACVGLCPNGAIVAGDELHTLADHCIKCCACVKGCPQGARRFDTPYAPLLSKYFGRRKENKTLL